MPTFDWHSHFLPPKFAEILRQQEKGARISQGPTGELLHTIKTPWPYDFAIHSDVKARLRALDDAGIDKQIFSWPQWDLLPLAESVPLISAYNDSAAELVSTYPKRFSAFASLPVEDPELAAQELNRVHEKLGLPGAVLPSEAFASLATARKLAPLLEVAQRHKSHLFIHPRFASPEGEPEPLPLDIDNRHARLGGLEVQARAGAAFFTLALTNLLEPYPDVTFHLVNLGGTIPFLAERLELFADKTGLGDVHKKLKRVYVDTANMGPRTIAFAASILGTDRILFGSDQPISTPLKTLEQLNASGLSEANRQTILHNNAGHFS